jgi:single-strand DNA-binding protein
MNKVMLIGNLGQDPEIKALNDGTKVANLSIATSERWRDKQTGDQREKTEWHRINIWGDGLVGVIEKYLAKGDQVMVVGKLQTRSWEDQDGKKHYATEVIVSGFKAELQILRCKAWDRHGREDHGGGDGGDYGDGNATGGRGREPGATGKREEFDDDIPF